jgi:hypothetical protein
MSQNWLTYRYLTKLIETYRHLIYILGKITSLDADELQQG